MTMTQTNTRNSGLEDLIELLVTQSADKVDAIVPIQAIRSTKGVLHIAGMGLDGPAGDPGLFLPTDIMDGHIAEKLGIPSKYLRWLRINRVDLYDENVNGLIHGYADFSSTGEDGYQMVGSDTRTVMVRAFINQAGGVGIGRALLSDRYATYDNLDMFFALLDGVKETGLDVRVSGCDLSERRMIVRMDSPDLLVHAPELMKGYRSPFGTESGGTYGTYNITAREEGLDVGDCVGGGIVATNSETGGGAWTIAPYFRFLACRNGVTINSQIMRSVHLGGKLGAGTIKWSDETQERNIGLITARTKDAVTAFLDEKFMIKVIEEMTEKATKPIENPAEMVELVAQRMHYTEDQQAGLLNHFIKGAQITTGGIMHAVTSYAQEIADGDTSYDFESSAIEAMEVAFAAS